MGAEAEDATRIVDVRPEVHHMLAYCASRRGRWEEARREIRRTRELDPRNAGYAYSEALIVAAEGGDPRPAARASLARRPIDEQARRLLGAYRDPEARRRFARREVDAAVDLR